MTDLVFYEKPGCVGNKQQKALLRRNGIQLEVKDILSEPWTAESLRPFFAEKPVAEWFNTTAPQVKNGEIAIQKLTESEALNLMIHEPILIRRPLLHYQSLKQSGFSAGEVLNKLGIKPEADQDLQSCPMAAQPCEVPL
ncbi:MAG: ArsC/Spx/MgsR family protein [Candidatus Thiodiazotropha sp.]|jgi:nitrogenase-associated protein